MKALGILLLSLVSAALLLAGYVGLLFVVRGAGADTPSAQGVFVALNAVASVLCVAVTCFAIGILWKVVRSLFPPRQGDDTQLRRRLVALCISAVLFQDFYSSLVRVIVAATIQLFSELSTGLDGSSLNRLIGETGNPSWPEALGQFWPLMRLFFQSLTAFLAGVTRSLATSDAVLAYVVWILSYFAMAGASTTDDRHASTPIQRLRTWFGAMDDSRRHHLVQTAVFLTGCYLSVAAMVAIPSLRKQVVDTSATKERLQSALETEAIPQNEFDRDYPENYAAARNPFASLESYMTNAPALSVSSPADTNLLTAAEATWRNRLDSASDVLKQAKAQRAALVIRWQNYRRQMSELSQSLPKKAISALDTDALSPQAGPERAAYFQDIKTWHRSSVAEVQRNLRQSMMLMDTLDEGFKQSSESLVATLGDELRLLQSSLKEGMLSSIGGSSSPLSYDLRALRSVAEGSTMNRYFAFEKPDIESRFPPPREPGDFSGPFGFIARWLLRTRSFSLALITGMIGFGLFGASIAQIIRTCHEGGIKTVPPDFAGMTAIQGLAAAVVLYLAVHGGLVLVSGADSEPNGYVLCFLCLVGSVFSDRVWSWASQRLNTILDGRSDSVTEKPKDNKQP